MNYHVWFGTKYRRRVLVAEIGEYVECQLRAIASSKGIRLVECKCYVDHAHLLLDVNEPCLPNTIRLLKGGSAYRTFVGSLSSSWMRQSSTSGVEVMGIGACHQTRSKRLGTISGHRKIGPAPLTGRMAECEDSDSRVCTPSD